MTKEKFTKHCEEQIERCIKLRDSKHLKEHELSLTLLNECEQRKQNQENLIKYIEEKIKKLKDECASFGHLIDKDTIHKYDLQIKLYEDLLERIKSDKYE